MRYFLTLLLLLLFVPVYCHETANVFVDGEKMGLKGDDGTILIPASYDKIGWSVGEALVVSDVIGYRINGKWGLISLNNTTVTPPEYHSLVPGLSNVIIAKKDDRAFRYIPSGVLDTDGAEMIPFIYASIKEAVNRTFILKKYESGEAIYGAADFEHRQILPFDFQEILYVGYERYAVRKGDKWGLLSRENEPLTGFEYDHIGQFENGYAKVMVRRSFGLLRPDGNMVVPVGYRDIVVDGGGVHRVAFPQWDVLTRENKKIHSVKFDSILPWEKNRWKVVANEYEWLVDENFNSITSNTFSNIRRLNNHLAIYASAGKYGVIYQNGETLIKAAFDSIYVNKGLIYGRADEGINQGWSIFNFTGKRISPFNFQGIGHEFDNGLIPVKRNRHWGFINRDGIEVISCTFDKTGESRDNHIVVGFQGGEGIIDTKGNWVITPGPGEIHLMNRLYYLVRKDGVNYLKHYEKGTVYFTSNQLKPGSGFLVETRNDGTFWKINLSGQIIEAHNNLDYDEIRNMHEGFIAVKIRGRFGFIDEQDRLRIAYRYDDVQDFSEGLAAFKLMNRWGYLNKQENIVIQPIYSEVTPFHKGLAIVQKNGYKGVIDTSGNIRIPFEYDEIAPLETGRYLIRKNDRYGLMDELGNIIVNPKFQDVSDLREGEVIVKQFGKYGLVSRQGDDLIPAQYDYMIYDPYNRCYLGMKKVD